MFYFLRQSGLKLHFRNAFESRSSDLYRVLAICLQNTQRDKVAIKITKKFGGIL